MNAQPGGRVIAWLATALVISIVVTTLVWVSVAVAVDPAPDGLKSAIKATAPGQILRLRQPGHVDSWYPMVKAYQRKAENPKTDLYAIFFVDRIKFQYPPSALLILDLFPRSMVRLVDGTIAQSLRRWFQAASLVALAVTIVVSAAILEVGLRRLPRARPTGPAQTATRLLLALGVGLMFYPLLAGHFLGQIQVFLNAILAFAVLFYLLGWRTLAGACFGAYCLVKPQYAVVLLWALMRRQRGFALGLLGVLLAGLAVSLIRFGLYDHLHYLKVVWELSRVGEAFWLNQSVNGLVNRLLENGSVLPHPLAHSVLPPYHPVVYALTTASSIAILALALWPRRGRYRADGGELDLMVMLVATTIASPIAWNHHYGVFLPIFAAGLPWIIHLRPLGYATAPIFVLGHFAIANHLVHPPLIFTNPLLGLAASHILFGGLIFFSLLLALQARGWRPTTGERPRSVGFAA